MAKLILKNCQIVVNSVDLSDHASSVEIEATKDDVDTTSFDGSGKEVTAGLQDTTITVTFQQDFAAANVDATLWPLWDNETEFTVAVRPTTGAISATNPEYTATCVLLEYSPLDGDVGDLSETEVEFVTQRGSLTRDTTP
jgi:hypothetical protein